MVDHPITEVRLYEVAIPLRIPFEISGGRMEERRSIVVALQDGAGVVGFGEAAPFERPFYSEETLSSVKACLEDVLIPRLLGRPIDGPDALHGLLDEGVRGNRMARAGVETAWWALAAARHNRSLADLVSERLRGLGVPAPWLARRPRIECGVAIGIPADEDADQLRNEIQRALGRGYRRIKLKIRPGWDQVPLDVCRQVMRDVGVRVPVWVDGNGAYDARRDGDRLRALERFEPLFLEQPFPPDAWADAIAWRGRTPLCLDETIVSDEVARQILDLGGPRIWNVKVQRLGGLEEACRVYARAVRAGVELWVGTMPETGIGAQAGLALAGHCGFVYPSDLEPSSRWYAPGADLVELEMGREGTMAVPSGPPPGLRADAVPTAVFA